jgi:hypothetical protein
MTTILTFAACLSCLLAGLFATRTRENRRLKKLVLKLSARLDVQNDLLARLKASTGRPADPTTPRVEPAQVKPARVEPTRVIELDLVEPAKAGPLKARPSEAGRPVTSRRSLPALSPAPARRRLKPLWPIFAALLVLGPAAVFLLWFSFTQIHLPPAFRLGVVLLASLASLSLGLLIWGKLPGLGLTLEGYGLGLIGLSLAGAAWFPGLLPLAPARAAFIGLGLFAAVLALKQNSPRLAVLVPLAFFSLWSVLNPGWTSLTLASAGAGIFYLAVTLAAGRSALSVRHLYPGLALASLNLALVSHFFNAPPVNISLWTILSLVFTLESVILLHFGRPRLGLPGLGLAALTVPLIPDLFSGALVSQFFLAASALGGALLQAAAKTERAEIRSFLIVLGPIFWLAASLASIWGFLTASADPSFILNWLLAVWSVFSLGLWLAGRLAPGLLAYRRPGSPPLLILAQSLPLIPALALALSFLWSFLGFTGWLGELNPAAWLLWSLAQGLGLAQARRLTPTAAWSNAIIITLALTLSQTAAALVQNGSAFGQDMMRLAAILGVLALCVRPPRLVVFQELSLCRIAGQILGGLALWRALTLALDPADRPGFFGFLPFLNLTDLAQAAAFWLPLAFLRRLVAQERPPVLDLLQRLVFFIWLNVVLARAIHHLTGLPYQLGALLGSANFWFVLAVVWGGLGLGAWFAGRRQLVTPEPGEEAWVRAD